VRLGHTTKSKQNRGRKEVITYRIIIIIGPLPGVGRRGVKMDALISHKAPHCSLLSAMRISLGMLILSIA
jgi:hypothetical protein